MITMKFIDFGTMRGLNNERSYNDYRPNLLLLIQSVRYKLTDPYHTDIAYLFMHVS